jgi:hypothetical protein
VSEQYEKVVIPGKEDRRFVRVPPDAGRTARAMGNLGYALERALADVIDNSIAAHATKVSVVMDQIFNNRVHIEIIDNGDGIRLIDLPAAIKYGAADRNDPTSLGVFGFGLKTACQSFTTRFAVCSSPKDGSDSGQIIFDENIISEHGDFLYETPDPSPEYLEKIKELGSKHGTAVVIEDADHFYQFGNSVDPRTEERKQKKYFKDQEDNVRLHLRKTFQRFVDVNDDRARNVEIIFNDEVISPWDPFCLKEQKTEKAIDETLSLQTKSGKQGMVIFRGFILPEKSEFEDQELKKDVGPNTHGIYVYRENRLIQMAEYFDLFRRETHQARARYELSYDGTLDELFQTGLQKDSISLGDLADHFKDLMKPMVRETDLRARGARNKKDTTDMHAGSQRVIGIAEKRINQAKITPIDEHSATVENQYGLTILPIESSSVASVTFINPVESITNGLLWEMRLQNGKQVVTINKSHEFYSKVYLPTKSNVIATRGLDALIWALAIAEANCTIPEYRRQFQDFKFEISKQLRELVEEFPEPKLVDEDE